MAISEELLQKISFNLLSLASIYLPEEIVNALKKSLKQETENIAKTQLEIILKNVEMAAKDKVCLCQDTGLPLFFIKLGTKVQLLGNPEKALWKAVEITTKEVPLRQNCIHPLTFKNSGTNTGWGIPDIHWEIVPDSDCLEITAIVNGFGPEIRFAQTWVLTSEQTSRAAVKAVLDVVEDSMGEPCPPIIVGIGIGGTAYISMYNAKKALFRIPFNSRHSDPLVADLEKEILEAVNDTKLGPMGFGGNNYALAVNIEIAGSHTAVVPISVGFQCWASRYSTAKIFNNGKVEYITHSKLIKEGAYV